jgi:hypothetical protein
MTPFDPRELAEQAISSRFDPGVFNQLDERDIKRAPNWLEFCVGAEFLAMEPGPFARQIQMAVTLFGEYCPRCSRPGYLESITVEEKLSDIRDGVVLLEHGVCPRCHVTQTELFIKKEIGEYNEFDACCGRRSGKTVLASMIAAYHLHRFLMLRNPASFYRVLQNQTLFMLFVAITKGQAEDTVWQAFKDRIDDAPWFRMYHAFLNDYAKRKGLKAVYDVKDTFLWYGHKRLTCELTTVNIKSSRGRTTFGTLIDEIGWLDVNSDPDGILNNAAETHHALAQSNATIRAACDKLRRRDHLNWVPTGLDINISSPSSANDMIMRLVRSSRTNSKACTYQYKTFEVNPTLTYEALADERAKDWRAYARDFEAEPPFGVDAFMDDEKLVARAIRPGVHNLLVARVCREPDPTDPSVETLWLESSTADRDKQVPRVLALDPGQSNNSFAMAVAHWRQDKQTVVIDGVLECRPEKHADGSVRTVNFPRMFDRCILPIVERLNIKLVVADHWQSADLMQRLRSDHKIRSETYTLKYEDFMAIRTLWYDGRVQVPEPERTLEQARRTTEQLDDFVKDRPILTGLIQVLTVRELGKKIVKPYGGTDDLFRAIALCCRFLSDSQTNRPFIYSGVDRPAGQAGRVAASVRSNRSGYAAPAGQKVGARLSRRDPYGLVGRPGR